MTALSRESSLIKSHVFVYMEKPVLIRQCCYSFIPSRKFPLADFFYQSCSSSIKWRTSPAIHKGARWGPIQPTPMPAVFLPWIWPQHCVLYCIYCTQCCIPPVVGNCAIKKMLDQKLTTQFVPNQLPNSCQIYLFIQCKNHLIYYEIIYILYCIRVSFILFFIGKLCVTFF